MTDRIHRLQTLAVRTPIKVFTMALPRRNIGVANLDGTQIYLLFGGICAELNGIGLTVLEAILSQNLRQSMFRSEGSLIVKFREPKERTGTQCKTNF